MRSGVDTTAQVGTVTLPNPVMTASGTSGHGAELSAYVDLSRLGAVVVKSVAAHRWEGNPPVRVVPAAAGMLNSVGLTGPGVDGWIRDHLPALAACGARTVASIWGHDVDGFARAAAMLRPVEDELIAVEVNASCPNIEQARSMFSHSAALVARVTEAVRGEIGIPVWIKLSPNVPDIVGVAEAALSAGSSGLTLVNTLIGMAIDVGSGRPILGGLTGGLSGPALHPVAVRAVFECRREFPDCAIVGAGGVSDAETAVEMLMAGADAVQVGTATFADPRAPLDIALAVERWCRDNGVRAIGDIVGVAQRR